MRGLLLRFLGIVVMVGVILLQRISVCCAAETTTHGVSATLYGGAGTLTVPNNETRDDEYEITRVGVGALGVWRPGASRVKGVRESAGFFAALGGAFELDSSLHSVCGYECYQPSDEGERYVGKHFAGRLGFGYSFPIFEFRLGALAAIPDSHVSYAMPMLIPDVMMRIGPRDFGWFELGLGAYSASTNFRPGLYLGGALDIEHQLLVSAHGGVHLVNGLCCGTVNMAGIAGELSVAHAFSSSLTGSLGAIVYSAAWSSEEHLVAEGSARIAFAL